MCNLLLCVSRSLPMADISLQRHSKDSSCSSFWSWTIQLCTMITASMFSLKSSPISFIFPRKRGQLGLPPAVHVCFSPHPHNTIRKKWIEDGQMYDMSPFNDAFTVALPLLIQTYLSNEFHIIFVFTCCSFLL